MSISSTSLSSTTNLEVIKKKALASSGADPYESDYTLVSRYHQIHNQFIGYWDNNVFDQAYASGIRIMALYQLLSSRQTFKDKDIVFRQHEINLVLMKLKHIEDQSRFQQTAANLDLSRPSMQSKNEPPPLKTYPSLDVSQQSRLPPSTLHQLSPPSVAQPFRPSPKNITSSAPSSILYPSFTDTRGSSSKPDISHLPASSHSSSAIAPSISDLRRTVVPLSLISQFLKLSSQNTDNGIETCGILGAIYEASSGLLIVSVLVIPKQRGDSDKTEMINEEELIQFFGGKAGVIQAGWIHTHPTQGCFLSSIDIHTQLSFQTQLPEAIAIVLDPKMNDYQVFRLTDERTVQQGRRGCNGLAALIRCSDRGFHHQHDGKETHLCYEISEEEIDSFTLQVPGMYHTCDSSKHVLIDESMRTTVYDLR